MALRHVLFYASTLRLCGRAWLVMTPELESARLLLRPLQLADAAYTQILHPLDKATGPAGLETAQSPSAERGFVYRQRQPVAADEEEDGQIPVLVSSQAMLSRKGVR